MSPGNIRFWYVQLRDSRAYIAWMSSVLPAPSGSSTCATMFWMEHCDSANLSFGMHCLRSFTTYRPE